MVNEAVMYHGSPHLKILLVVNWIEQDSTRLFSHAKVLKQLGTLISSLSKVLFSISF